MHAVVRAVDAADISPGAFDMKRIAMLAEPSRLDLTVQAPPSKAHTLRAIFLAALAGGTSRITHPLLAGDQLAALECVGRLGASWRRTEDALEITGLGAGDPDPPDVAGPVPANAPPTILHCRESGLTARVLTAVGCVLNRDLVIDGAGQLREKRPVSDLVDVLRVLGFRIEFLEKDGLLPLRIFRLPRLPRKSPRPIPCSAAESSQYLTALLMSAPFLADGLALKARGPVRSAPYVEITIDMMAAFGLPVTRHREEYRVPPGRYRPAALAIEGDYSSAAFFGEAAALTGGRVRIDGLSRHTRQGDRVFFHLLERMGCQVREEDCSVTVSGRPGRALDIDMGDFPDVVLPLAVVMGHTPGSHRITGIGHLRLKESDRLRAAAANLRKLGADAREGCEELRITGRDSFTGDVALETFHDHRVAMSFGLAGLVTPGVSIDDAACVAKSFPSFWENF